jgi:hypothetical protein
VLAVEAKRDGVLASNMLAVSTQPASIDDPSVYYIFEYTVDSTRGNNHFLVKVAVANGRLYVMTVQAKQQDFEELRSSITSIVRSFTVRLNTGLVAMVES